MVGKVVFIGLEGSVSGGGGDGGGGGVAAKAQCFERRVSP